MTDKEEMARQYLIEKYGLRKDIEIEIIQRSLMRIEYSTYLEGLKAGEKLGFEKGVKAKVNTTTISDCPVKPVWHSVAAGDLPPVEKGNYTISVLTDKGNIAYYSYNYDCWIEEPSSGEIDPPIAWCEIPRFEGRR